MWFKKILVKLTIKLLNWLKDKDFGEFDDVIDKYINQGIKALTNNFKERNKWKITLHY